MVANPGDLILERQFDAPRSLVWKAWTEADRLAHWWGPVGFSWKHCTLDLRPGGLFHYCMVGPTGAEMWGKFVYQVIVPEERLDFVVSFSDPSGGIQRHPLSTTWPLEVFNSVGFVERDGRTVLTMRGGPINATEIERKTFDDHRSSVQKGFGATLDQLDEYLQQTGG